ncbi:MAG TPA: glycosyltransferase [Gemmatimonadales bacterium]|nr:glycosyltransferase [Gemmatimonadales bacterium]
MIYVCIPSHNEARTVGLLLWKVRQTFTDFPREYQLLVVDDASTDATREVLEPYARVLPLTLIRHAERQGYAASITELLRMALERTDRPRRDAAILMHADFAHDAAALPDLVRQIESGADLVVAEGELHGTPSPGHRLVRRVAPLLLGRRVRVPGVRDLVGGFAAFRLVTLRDAFRDRPTGPVLASEGWAANAELLGLAARHARRVERIRAVERLDRRERASRNSPWATALSLWRSRRTIKLPAGRPVTASGDPPATSLPAT